MLRPMLLRFVDSWQGSLLHVASNVCTAIRRRKPVGSIELRIRSHLGHILEPMTLMHKFAAALHAFLDVPF